MGNIKLHMVDSKNIYGTMNGGTVRMSNITEADKKLLKDINGFITTQEVEGLEITPKDKALIFEKHRQAFGEAEGFDWKKMFMADQTTKNGSYFELTQDFVEANPKGWADIPEDILIITDKVPGVVAGHPVADCPVVMLEDRKQGITAVGHCGGNMIDKKLPMLMAEVMYRSYHSKHDDLVAHVGAAAGPKWSYDSMPPWATETEIWRNAIIPHEVIGEDGKRQTIFKIDIRQPIIEQLGKMNVSINSIDFDITDTLTNPLYYSNAMCGEHPEKFGRQYIGAFYDDGVKVKGKVK